MGGDKRFPGKGRTVNGRRYRLVLETIQGRPSDRRFVVRRRPQVGRRTTSSAKSPTRSG